LTFAALRTTAFRNLADREVETRGKDVFLVGENGQGKTNFLEALYFCSYASSFRGVRDGELVRAEEKDCSVSAQLQDPLYRRILVKIEKGKKTIDIDGKRASDRKELLSVIPCIVFCHEDMEFVSGTPEERRWFFDQTQSLYDSVYLDDLRKYRRVLKTRNAVLKDAGSSKPFGSNQFSGADNSSVILDTLDPQIAEYGLRLMEKREEAVAHFSEIFSPLYEAVSGIEGIEVRYAPSWKHREDGGIRSHLAERRDQERMLGISLSGPHRDRYLFLRRGEDFSAKASTGQRRLLALLLRIAQARRFSLMTGKNPVLLLDDVLLELDPEKRRKFLEVMPEYDQAFYTFLPEEPFERYRRADTLVYRVAKGELSIV
jgi:DNA replication and repair protein RecF